MRMQWTLPEVSFSGTTLDSWGEGESEICSLLFPPIFFYLATVNLAVLFLHMLLLDPASSETKVNSTDGPSIQTYDLGIKISLSLQVDFLWCFNSDRTLAYSLPHPAQMHAWILLTCKAFIESGSLPYCLFTSRVCQIRPP